MTEKFKWRKIGWVVVYLVVIANLLLLYQLRKQSMDTPPLDYLQLEKPTLVIVFHESECATCVENLFFLNDLYTTIKAEGRLEFQGIILSSEKQDPKGIAKAFIFPVLISDDFNIMRQRVLTGSPRRSRKSTPGANMTASSICRAIFPPFPPPTSAR